MGNMLTGWKFSLSKQLFLLCNEGSGHFWGFKILNFNIFGGGGGQKNEYFGGYKDFVDIFGGSYHKVGIVLGIISMYFMVFSYGRIFFWVR